MASLFNNPLLQQALAKAGANQGYAVPKPGAMPGLPGGQPGDGSDPSATPAASGGGSPMPGSPPPTASSSGSGGGSMLSPTPAQPTMQWWNSLSPQEQKFRQGQATDQGGWGGTGGSNAEPGGSIMPRSNGLPSFSNGQWKLPPQLMGRSGGQLGRTRPGGQFTPLPGTTTDANTGRTTTNPMPQPGGWGLSTGFMPQTTLGFSAVGSPGSPLYQQAVKQYLAANPGKTEQDYLAAINSPMST